jgi:hypothetical protein
MVTSLFGFENNGHHSSGVEANYKKRKKCFCFRKYNNLNSESQKRIMDSVVLYTDPKHQYLFASNRINRSIASCRSSKDLLYRYVQRLKKEINGLKQKRSGFETSILEPDPPAKKGTESATRILLHYITFQ